VATATDRLPSVRISRGPDRQLCTRLRIVEQVAGWPRFRPRAHEGD